MFSDVTLWFLIILLVVGTIFEFVLHRRQVRFLEKQRDAAEQEARAADHLISDLLMDQVVTISQRDAARKVADAAERQTMIYHQSNQHLVETAKLRNRIMADLSNTVHSMTITHDMLLDEIERLTIENAMRELGGTEPVISVHSRQHILDMAQAKATGGHDA